MTCVPAEWFHAVYGWFYSTHLADSPEVELELSIEILCDIYGFAEIHIVPTLQNYVLDVILHKVRHNSDSISIVIEWTYQKLPAGSPLRSFAVEAALIVLDFSTKEALGRQWRNDEFLEDMLVKAISGSKAKQNEWTKINIVDFYAQPLLSTCLALSTKSKGNAIVTLANVLNDSGDERLFVESRRRSARHQLITPSP
ncbi:hypothetical protein MMC25_008323 [Agyrium rufum]|nr:hypothetical protein [Agyrium rufum]